MDKFVILSAVLSIVCSAVSESGLEGGAGKVISVAEEDAPLKNSTSATNTISGQTPGTASQSIPPSYKEDCTDNKFDASTCPSNVECSQLGGDCIQCDFNCTCIYGQTLNVSCSPLVGVGCKGVPKFEREIVCRYCYQSDPWQYTCSGYDPCKPVSTPRKLFTSNCTMRSEVICLGRRKFLKRLPCNWTSGYRWTTALLLSITLGGFGADRFYLGYWQEGIGKLFSFGGLGVWTIMDVILISIRYLGPEDGSLYI